jgi:hypothetical protein
MVEILVGKLVSFKEVLSTWLSRIKYNKLKVEYKVNKAIRTYEATFNKEE